MTPRERSDVCRGHARCIRTHTPREFCPVVILRPAAWGLHGWREAADLARRCRVAGTGWPFAETVTRQPWWRPAGARGRACRDPRKHALTCPACLARIPLDTRPGL